VRKKVSLKDVANHVGVSTALVSKVLNGKEKEARVSAQMAEKVRKAASQLNYQPNLIAKSLKSGKSGTIGLIVADISNPFFSNIARIIEDEAKKKGYVVIFGSSDENNHKQEDLINVFLNRQVDAFIITPAAGSELQIRELKKNGVPVVLIDRSFPGVLVDSVHIDNLKASFKAVQHLIDAGRRKIAMVAYDSPLANMKQRIQGYKDALKRNRLAFVRERLIQVTYSSFEEEVRQKIYRLLLPLTIDAVVFASNSMAMAGLKLMQELQIKIPEQLAVISFDKSDVFDLFYSPVSYISQSETELGKEAVLLVTERISNEKKKAKHVAVDAQLVIRESSGIN
jgi:LacI family transcriptional regulator